MPPPPPPLSSLPTFSSQKSNRSSALSMNNQKKARRTNKAKERVHIAIPWINPYLDGERKWIYVTWMCWSGKRHAVWMQILYLIQLLLNLYALVRCVWLAMKRYLLLNPIIDWTVVFYSSIVMKFLCKIMISI